MQITETLNQRQATHGDYAKRCVTSQMLKNIMYDTPNWNALTADKRESLELIATKISRILHGDPEHHDSWLDIGGYAALIHEALNAK